MTDAEQAQKLADEIEENLKDYRAYAHRGMMYEAFSTDEIRLIVEALRRYE